VSHGDVTHDTCPSSNGVTERDITLSVTVVGDRQLGGMTCAGDTTLFGEKVESVNKWLVGPEPSPASKFGAGVLVVSVGVKVCPTFTLMLGGLVEGRLFQTK
jgi:hypothetical protein